MAGFMMPPTVPGQSDLVRLIIENCQFISPPDVHFAIITPMATTHLHMGRSVTPWEALVLRTVDGYRDVFLSASGPSPQDALYELLSRSADAARTRIQTNGFAVTPCSISVLEAPKDRKSDMTNPGSLPIDVLDIDSSSSSGCESLSDNETVSIASGPGEKKSNPKSRKQHKRKDNAGASNKRQSRSRSRSRSSTRSVSRSRSRSRSSSSNSDFETPRAPLPYQPPNSLPRPAGMGARPPPAPGFECMPPRMPGAPTARASAPSPPAQVTSSPNPRELPLHDVLIRIHWVGRGYAQVMKRLVPNQRTLHATVLSYVRGNPGVFDGAHPSDHHALKMPLGLPGSQCLFASLRSVSVAGEHVDLRNYQGDNLSTLIQEAHDTRAGLPKFEIDVQSSSPPPPFPHGAKGFGRPTSTGPVVSEC